jgi:putative peptidoglycan lipid II flippase
MVAWALALYALGLPAHSIVEVIVRAFYALHDTMTPVVVGIGAMALNVALSLAFLSAFEALGWMPHGGLALSNSLATTVEMAILVVLLRRRLGGLEGRRLLGSLTRIGLASAALGVAAAGVGQLLAGTSVWLYCGVAVVAGLVAYVGFTLLLGAPEPRAMWAMMRSKQ